MAKTLGDYELLIRLAAGGGANVFLARDTTVPSRLVALKVILPQLVRMPQAVQAFFTEAKLAAHLDHPNIVAIAGFGENDGVYGLAMEYVFGASLADLLNTSNRTGKPMTVCSMLEIVSRMCDALQYAHDLESEDGEPLQLIHRDVSPENILLGFDGVPKLADFGIAKALNRGWETQAGILKGKSRYMSPEQLLGKRVDQRSDIFLTGIVLWEALTGRPLFTAASVMDTFKAIGQRPIPTPSEASPGLPPVVDPIVMKALQRVPSRRYQTMAEMRDAIDKLLLEADVEITDEAIARELAEVYGDIVGRRRRLLRDLMAGEDVDLEELARVMGGEPLHSSQLPSDRIKTDDSGIVALLTKGRPPSVVRVEGLAAKSARFAETTREPQVHDTIDLETTSDPGAELRELIELEDDLLETAKDTPSTELTGWRDWRNQTFNDRTTPLLSLTEEEIRSGKAPAAFLKYLDANLESAQTNMDIPAVDLDGETIDADRGFSVVRRYVNEAMAGATSPETTIPDQTLQLHLSSETDADQERPTTPEQKLDEDAATERKWPTTESDQGFEPIGVGNSSIPASRKESESKTEKAPIVAPSVRQESKTKPPQRIPQQTKKSPRTYRISALALFTVVAIVLAVGFAAGLFAAKLV